MNIEILGTLASVVILISFTMKDEKHIRLVNMAGSLVFIVYGICINAFAVWFLNVMIILVNIYKLAKQYKKMKLNKKISR